MMAFNNHHLFGVYMHFVLQKNNYRIEGKKKDQITKKVASEIKKERNNRVNCQCGFHSPGNGGVQLSTHHNRRYCT